LSDTTPPPTPAPTPSKSPWLDLWINGLGLLLWVLVNVTGGDSGQSTGLIHLFPPNVAAYLIVAVGGVVMTINVLNQIRRIRNGELPAPIPAVVVPPSPPSPAVPTDATLFGGGKFAS